MRDFHLLYKKNLLFTHNTDKELQMVTPLRDDLLEWMRTYKDWSEKTRKDFTEKVTVLFRRTQNKFPNPTHGDIQSLLQEYRKQCEERNSPSTFRHVKNVFSRFVKSRYGKSHDLYLQLSDVESLRNPTPDSSGTRSSKSVEQIERLSKVLPSKYRPMLWTMCTLGVGWKEYESIEIKDDIKHKRVYVVGTKMDKKDRRRRREVPYVIPPHPPICTEKNFYKVLKQFGKKVRLDITTYSLRHSYSRWMEECGVPRWRVQMYMGHLPKNQTEQYQRGELWNHLVEDGEKLRKYIEIRRKTSHH
jgi:integrase